MDDHNPIAVVTALMSDHDYQTVNMRGVDLWLLLCACQLAHDTSTLSPTLRNVYHDLGKRLQAIVVHIHPDAKEIAARGWDTFVDMTIPDEPVNPYEGWSFPSHEADEPYYGDEEEF